MKIEHCGSCQAPVIWVRTVNRIACPLDAEPVEGGNVRLIDGVAHVRPVDLFDVPDDDVRYVSHFVTCPDSKAWRSKR